MNQSILRTTLIVGTLATAALTGCVTITNTLPTDRGAQIAAAPTPPAQHVASTTQQCGGACCGAHAATMPYGYDPRGYGAPVYQPTADGRGYYPPQSYPPQSYPYPPQYYPPQGYPAGYGYPQVIYVPVPADDDRIEGTTSGSPRSTTTATPRTTGTGTTIGAGSSSSRGTRATRRAEPVAPPKSGGMIGSGAVVTDRRADAATGVGAQRRGDESREIDVRPVERPERVDVSLEAPDAGERVTRTPPIAEPERARTETGDSRPVQRTPEPTSKESVRAAIEPADVIRAIEKVTVAASPRPATTTKVTAPKTDAPVVAKDKREVPTKLEEDVKVDAEESEPVSRREDEAPEPSTVTTVAATKRSAD
jgi:hypothetical protein